MEFSCKLFEKCCEVKVVWLSLVGLFRCFLEEGGEIVRLKVIVVWVVDDLVYKVIGWISLVYGVWYVIFVFDRFEFFKEIFFIWRFYVGKIGFSEEDFEVVCEMKFLFNFVLFFDLG